MSYYLCVDCGGSKTATAICDASGQILGRAFGGPSNFAYLGPDNFIDVVGTTPLLPPPTSSPLFAAAWLGVSGVDSAAAIARLTPPLAALLGVVPIVCNDTHLLAAPLRMHPDVSAAIGCVSGTGGIVVSFKEGEGAHLEELGRVGGWGWILGDEGGGFHVGREAVRQILFEADRASVMGPVPAPVSSKGGVGSLKARVLARFGITDVFELLTIVHWPDPVPDAEVKDDAPAYTRIAREKRLSSLAPLVFAAAFEDHDPLAIDVLRHTSRELVDQICILLRPETGDAAAYPPRTVKASETILCFGGSLVGVEAYRKMVLDELEKRGHVFRRVEFVEDAAATGAKALAAALQPKVKLVV
ncbi:N-acetyl-D-glucosamine kinase [Grifola frondosa]|uniref:N-acetyl-D-glucosamine kinase n=1 Tax=Grifola frondosa TaxID=5627 RepID=A0A1C7M3A8_GRIFR|nr:N-acetyl-D-glucosamine kinase [Grifola frondosa]